MKKKKKVAIVMSTYNGEKYIAEQLDSLINQTYNAIDIYIRDDGSKDKTISILKEYENKYNNIYLFLENNLGYAKSFYKIVEIAKNKGNYSYYAFCDQDDSWNIDKVEKAVKMMGNNEKPTCLFTEYNCCDEKMNFICKSKLNNGKISFLNSLAEATISGNTLLFNDKLVDEFLNFNIDTVICHDWLVYMIATGIGNIIYDSEPSLKYRRTGSNASPRGNGKIKLMIYRIKKFIFGDYLKGLRKQIMEYNKLLHDQLSNKNKKIISLFIYKRYNFIKALKKFFYPHRFRQKILDEILIRFVFLIGKL